MPANLTILYYVNRFEAAVREHQTLRGNVNEDAKLAEREFRDAKRMLCSVLGLPKPVFTRKR